MSITRYAICLNRGKTDEFYYCQGSPKDMSLSFAIFYASEEYARKAIKKMLPWYINRNPEIVAVKCEVL